ncbi:hypothetical protein OROHE_024588 [Orobanche hederae]
MFIAATKDGNEQIVSLAFGIGDKENDLSWTWFLQQVRRTFGSPENLLIVSDQHLSIKNAVDLVYPGVHHGLCSFHIQRNLTKYGFGPFVIDIFKDAATAYKSRDLEKHMQNLLQSAPPAYERLIKIDPMKWAICKCPVRRYGMGTSNAVENLNARIKWARTLSDYARLSPSIFVHTYYTTQTWRQIYAVEVMPIPDKDEWIVPSDVALRVIGTPTNPKQAGRPRSKRILSGYHKKHGRVCSRCHQQGHYQNTCTTFLQTPPLEEVSSNQPSGSRPRKPKKCGICGVAGHTRLTCQDPHRF